jgi:hypothetical protein
MYSGEAIVHRGGYSSTVRHDVAEKLQPLVDMGLLYCDTRWLCVDAEVSLQISFGVKRDGCEKLSDVLTTYDPALARSFFSWDGHVRLDSRFTSSARAQTSGSPPPSTAVHTAHDGGCATVDIGEPASYVAQLIREWSPELPTAGVDHAVHRAAD